MPSTEDLGMSPRRVLHVFYVLDTSGSMEGTRIAMLNKAMGETTMTLCQQAEKNADAIIKLAVLEFNSGCRWMQPKGPEEMQDFIWNDLSAGGLTDMGEALKELNDKLSESAFLSSDTGNYLPIIIFMTDGYASDDYLKELKKIQKNKWFARGIKIGFAIGDDPDRKMIADVVGDSSAVITTEDLSEFARQLCFVSVTSTMLGSRSRTSQNTLTGRDVVIQAMEEELVPKESVDPDIPYVIPDEQDLEDFDDSF